MARVFKTGITAEGDITTSGKLKITEAAANEGGQIELAVPSSGSAINTNVTIDVYQNKLRFFEAGGTNRGYYVDITGGASSAGTSLTGGSTGAMNASYTYATKQSNVSSAGTVLASVSLTTNGYPIQVIATGDMENNSAGGWVVLQLYRGSTAIGNIVHAEGSAASENVPFALTAIDVPAAGTYTYSLKINNSAGGTFNFGESNGPTITVVELAGPKGDTGSAGATYTLPTATSTVLGGVELFSDTVQTVSANAVTTTASRTYGLQLNSSGQLVVNVPWTDTDTNTTYDLTSTGTTTASINLVPSSGVTDSVTITGSGATSVSHSAGAITITSTDTDTTYTLASGTNNGTLKLTPSSGSVQDNIAVTGLGSAAYTAAADYATSSHTHGNITNAGAIGSTANRVIVTTTSGALTTATGTSQSATTYLRGDLTWVTPTDTNWYPTTFSWTGGTTSGPTGSLTGSGMSAVSFAAVPSASATASGVVTTGAQSFAGAKTFATSATGATTTMYGDLYVYVPTAGGLGTIYGAGGVESGTNIYAGNVISHTGKSATTTSQDSGVYMNPNGYVLSSRSAGIPYYAHRYSTSGTVQMFQFIYNGTNNGTINVASGGTPAFASGSDYRMKTDVTPVTDAIQRMKNAKAYTFYKINSVDPSDNLHTGFLAHELADVQPDAVIGEKDAVDENGDPIYQEVMEAKIIPVMAQAINDLIGMVESLTARIEALEA